MWNGNGIVCTFWHVLSSSLDKPEDGTRPPALSNDRQKSGSPEFKRLLGCFSVHSPSLSPYPIMSMPIMWHCTWQTWSKATVDNTDFDSIEGITIPQLGYQRFLLRGIQVDRCLLNFMSGHVYTSPLPHCVTSPKAVSATKRFSILSSGLFSSICFIQISSSHAIAVWVLVVSSSPPEEPEETKEICPIDMRLVNKIWSPQYCFQQTCSLLCRRWFFSLPDRCLQIDYGWNLGHCVICLIRSVSSDWYSIPSLRVAEVEPQTQGVNTFVLHVQLRKTLQRGSIFDCDPDNAWTDHRFPTWQANASLPFCPPSLLCMFENMLTILDDPHWFKYFVIVVNINPLLLFVSWAARCVCLCVG